MGEVAKDSYFLYLDSVSFSQKYYIQNSPLDFISNVLDPIFLKGFEYEVALAEITWKGVDRLRGINYSDTFLDFGGSSTVQPVSNQDIYVLCDIISPEVQVGDKFLPLLRVVKEPMIFQTLYYFPLNRDYIEQIRIYLRKSDNTLPELKLGAVRCILHIRKKQYLLK